MSYQDPFTRRDYQRALDSQSACNPGALALSLSRFQGQIHDAGGSTDLVRQHPIIRLVAYQIAWLTGMTGIGDSKWQHAYQACRDIAAHDTP